MTPKWPATVENGKLQLNDPESFKTWIATNLSGEVTVTVEKRTNKRSNQQNRYLWGVLLSMAADATGFDEYEVKGILCKRFLTKVVEKNGKVYEATLGTSGLTTVEFNKFFEDCWRFAAEEWNIYIPDPSGF